MGITMQIYNTYICPSTNSLMDLGSSTKQWKNLYLDGLAYIDALGEDLSANGFDIIGIATLYGVDTNISIDMGTDGQLNLSSDTSMSLSSAAITIGNTPSQTLGFFGTTPVIQQSKITDPTDSGWSLELAVEQIIDVLEAYGLTAST